MQNPKVSVLIPFKNTEEFLPECISSIIDQTYQNWEVLAVNDSSDDNSCQIMDDYAKQDSRITVLQNEGQGIIHALRTAYSKSSGSLITRMDSDDIMTPNKLQLMTSALLNNGLGHVALGKVFYFSKGGVSNGYKSYEKWLNRLSEKGTNFSEIYKECVIPSPCWMVHRSDLDKAKAFIPDQYPEDYDLAFRFYEKQFKCIPSESVLHYWRDYQDRTSRTSEHYAQNYFLDLKMHYFLKLDHDKNRPLVLWGAGKKGKNIAKILIEQGVPFFWLCNNQQKIGKNIYGQNMLSYKHLPQLKRPQVIVTVANKEAQEFIKEYLGGMNMLLAEDYFLFC
ncbi:glycosyltransferase family 2 protein [Arenibacter sp. 6A1]|uniref:glycosyltransferase family 2 protein n=1 Tax=Arenibacter sp. 6A1 TaxID=2720391 RepID=UPI0014474FA6|nr:glycosyltransferase family 2 protein [Arenibacter sp. 6A1]NKI25062.1 glycosyltransferase family 2 protein [Arenibacter sp. 6A1]